MEVSSPSLPHDVFLEILKRIPMKFLGKFALLSKECNKSIHLSYFKNMHSKQTGTIRGFFLQSLSFNSFIYSFVSANSETIEFPLNFLRGNDLKILAVAPHGLMLCTTEIRIHRTAWIYSICKPAIRGWKKLPNPKTRFYTIQTAMIVVRSNPLHFKIIRISESSLHSQQIKPTFHRFFCEIFDSDTWRWKRLDDILAPLHVMFGSDAAVLASGAVLWKLLRGDLVFEFRFDSEKWSIFSMPDLNSRSSIKMLAEYEGKLALMFMERPKSSSMEVWQYEKKVWNKKIIILNEHLMISWRLPMAFLSSDIAVMCEYGRLVYSKFEKKSCSKIRIQRSSPRL